MSTRIGIVVCLLALMIGCSCDCDELEKNKTVVVKAAEILNSHDYTELGTVVAENYKRHCQATPGVVVESLDDFKVLLQQWDQEIPDGTITLDMMIAEGDVVAAWGTYSGTQEGPMGEFPATGKRLEAEMGVFHRIEEGKIAETWVIWDNMAILGQLGLLPPPDSSKPDVSAD